MTLNASMKNRVRRLELRQTQASRPGIAERLRRARERLEAMTPQQRAAERCEFIARSVAAANRAEPAGDDLKSRLDRSMWRFGQEQRAAMASLDEPDLVEPPELDLSAHHAWWEQQHNRKVARKYLADVALAGDLFKEQA